MRRSGFTLIEVLVALALAAVVVLLAHGVFAAVVDGAARVQAARTALDREANARRWLVQTFGSLTVGQAAGGFDGEPTQVTFTTWLPTAERGFELAQLTVAVEGGRLEASLSSGGTIVLAHDVASAAFDYLLEPGANAHWVEQWVSPVSAPVAVRMRVTRVDATGVPSGSDTLLLLVGPRG